MSTPREVIGKLLETSKIFRKECVDGMNRGSLKFIGHIQVSQMSGRPGLRARSGRLRGSWFPKTTYSDGDIRSRIGTNVKYAKIHQDGGEIKPRRRKYLVFKVDGHFVSVRRVRIPKRLFVPEAMAKLGASFYRPELKKAFQNSLQSKGL